ncbi:hypothetical protein [Oryza sativa Japonica Group]|uniref:Uncharacterized protein n=1 Tax=Oryza sativa subsp. japonica TaxID=39947 RepID=Q657X3_ORYSJ|nr:hypothetical protein [Oryza sativa Japonica Group]BAD44894.1 hypothetical protein [Oryza sativa Japonica Group]
MLSSSSPAGGALVLPLGLAESAGEEGRCVLSARHVLLSPRQSGRCSWRFRRSSARLPWSHSRTVAIPASVVEMTKSSQPILIMNPRISQLVASNKESTTIHKAEVVACLAGARAANALGMGHVVFETDSIILKQAMDADDHRLAATALGCKCPRNTVEQWDMMPPGMEDLVASDFAESLNNVLSYLSKGDLWNEQSYMS